MQYHQRSNIQQNTQYMGRPNANQYMQRVIHPNPIHPISSNQIPFVGNANVSKYPFKPPNNAPMVRRPEYVERETVQIYCGTGGKNKNEQVMFNFSNNNTRNFPSGSSSNMKYQNMPVSVHPKTNFVMEYQNMEKNSRSQNVNHFHNINKTGAGVINMSDSNRPIYQNYQSTNSSNMNYVPNNYRRTATTYETDVSNENSVVPMEISNTSNCKVVNYEAKNSNFGTVSTSSNGKSTQVAKKDNHATEPKTSDFKKTFGSRPAENVFILTGTAERLIYWNKILNTFCYYEVISTLVSIQEGSVRTQKIMLLRDRTGPILQVVYYPLTHIAIDDFHLGKVIRCVGKMIGQNIFHAISIRDAYQEEVENLQRMTLISEQSINMHLKK